ncbi:MAG: IS630 family transposase [Oligoflexales bacterium]
MLPNKFLSEDQRQELLSELRIERERRFADRIRVILLIDEGRRYSDIATFLFLDEKTIRNWKRRYEEGGVEKLVNDGYMGRASLLDDEQIKLLGEHLSTRIFTTTRQIVIFVKSEFGVYYTIGGMTSLLHRLGFSYKKAKGVPAKADATAQQNFVKEYQKVKKKGLVYFADSTHPTLQSVLSYGWIKTGEDFEVKTSSGRQRININGAIELTRQDVITRTCQTVNQQSMCDLLRAIRKKNSEEKKIFLVLDNAAYNKALSVRELGRHLNIEILYLPPYSPNLNPIERLWKFMKKETMANQYYDSLESFKKSVASFFRGIKKHKNRLESLLTDNFQIMGA